MTDRDHIESSALGTATLMLALITASLCSFLANMFGAPAIVTIITFLVSLIGGFCLWGLLFLSCVPEDYWEQEAARKEREKEAKKQTIVLMDPISRAEGEFCLSDGGAALGHHHSFRNDAGDRYSGIVVSVNGNRMPDDVVEKAIAHWKACEEAQASGGGGSGLFWGAIGLAFGVAAF